MIEWRLVFISTGEQSLAEKLAEGGRRSRAGQEVRVVEIAADAGAGHGLYQDLHGFADGAKLSRHLKRSAEQNKGHAARAFLELLTGDPEALPALLDLRAAWLAQHLPPAADGQVERVAGRFALIAAAGELAVLGGILPWPEGEAERAAAACFNAWRTNRGGDGPSEISAAFAQVRLFIERDGDSRFDAPWNEADAPRTVINRAGYRILEADGWQYMILPEVWRQEVCKGFDASAVAKAMVDRGWLLPGEDGRADKKKRVPKDGNLRLFIITSRFLSEPEDDELEAAA